MFEANTDAPEISELAPPSNLVERIDRLESLDAIRQLPAKYALALDMRDSDAWVNLFPADVKVGKDSYGRKALRDWFDVTHSSQFDGTSHHIGGHIIDFDDADNAQGIVYSKNEHECGSDWVIMQMMYFDRYERLDGRWYFRRRLPLYWYASDLNCPPIGDRKMRWPGVPPYPGSFHDLFPSWKSFWERGGSPHDGPVDPPAPFEKFLDTMRKGSPLPRPRVRS
ncbi:MAG: nuclear transport factor 2 family protein [Novosphingobium sp.]